MSETAPRRPQHGVGTGTITLGDKMEVAGLADGAIYQSGNDQYVFRSGVLGWLPAWGIDNLGSDRHD